jgi:hypothetical protein
MKHSMTDQEVEDLIRHAYTVNMVEDKLSLVTWAWSDKLGRRMGCCCCSVGDKNDLHIMLSSVLFPRASDYERRNTVIHEACHATENIRVGIKKHAENNHGFDWETMVLRTGYEPFQYHTVDIEGVEETAHPLTMPDNRVYLK